MEKNKKVISIALVALFLSIIGIGIAFAAMSQQLIIEGEVAFNPADWKVRFQALSLDVSTTGSAEIPNVPMLTATTIGTYEIVLTKPGDSATLKFNVENVGNLEAIVAVLTKPDPICTGTGTSKTADEDMVCNNLIYTLTNDSANGTGVAIGQTLAKTNGVQTMVLHIEYPITMSTVPADDVTVALPQVVITYEQD